LGHEGFSFILVARQNYLQLPIRESERSLAFPLPELLGDGALLLRKVDVVRLTEVVILEQKEYISLLHQTENLFFAVERLHFERAPRYVFGVVLEIGGTHESVTGAV